MKRLLFLLSLLLLAGNAEPNEGAFRVVTFPKVIRQGEVCLIRAYGSADSVYATFQGQKLQMTIRGRDGSFGLLLGIDMETSPGEYEIKIEGRDKDEEVRTSSAIQKVATEKFGKQALSLPRSMVDLDAKTLERVNQETNRLEAIFRKSRDERIWQGPFMPPLKLELVTPFGIRRIINGRAEGAHTGVDLRAAEGTPVLACNAGVVVLSDELFFSGKSVILDHGGGIYSMYFHLSQAAVSEGEAVEKAAMIGSVGSTGRSTGPHLHWGIRMNGGRVNPFSLLKTSGFVRE